MKCFLEEKETYELVQYSKNLFISIGENYCESIERFSYLY